MHTSGFIVFVVSAVASHLGGMAVASWFALQYPTVMPIPLTIIAGGFAAALIGGLSAILLVLLNDWIKP